MITLLAPSEVAKWGLLVERTTCRKKSLQEKSSNIQRLSRNKDFTCFQKQLGRSYPITSMWIMQDMIWTGKLISLNPIVKLIWNFKWFRKICFCAYLKFSEYFKYISRLSMWLNNSNCLNNSVWKIWLNHLQTESMHTSSVSLSKRIQKQKGIQWFL